MTVSQRFRELFGRHPEVVVRSPGRVNLIGEHTDYNAGWVLPAAIDLGTDIATATRGDRVLRVVAQHFDTQDVFSLDALDPLSGAAWTRYVRGMVSLLSLLGADPVGADILITGDLPLGAGLSSSASLEMGVGVALCTLAGVEPDRVELARLGQLVENEIVGVRSGIMDQLAVACGRSGHALRVDCRDLETAHVPFPKDLRLLVLDSAVPRALAGTDYNLRRKECDMAVETIRTIEPSVGSLRDVTIGQLESFERRMPEVTFRRARHVVTENHRVSEVVDALVEGDLDTLGRLFSESHESLRDDFEVSCEQIEQLVTLAASTNGVRAARLTGAGFGGCVVGLVDAAQAARAAASIVSSYQEISGLPGRAYVCDPADGCSTRAAS